MGPIIIEMSKKLQNKRSKKPRKFPKKVNRAKTKYQREELLSLYSISPRDFPEIFSSILTAEAEPPVLKMADVFSHTLGKEINSRKPVRKEDKVEITEELPSKVEEQAKQTLLMTYSLKLLQYNKSKGVFFADLLLESGSVNNDLVCMVPYTKPFEKVWFYKDPEQRVQGPFSTIEMFNWTARGCFPDNLEISYGLNACFVPMNQFAPRQKVQSSKSVSSTPEKRSLPIKSFHGFAGMAPVKDQLRTGLSPK